MKSKITQVQSLQDQAAKLALPKHYHKLSTRQRHKVLNWLTIEKEIERSTHIFTHKVLNQATPQEISSQIPPNNKTLRIGAQNKLDTKPRWLSSSKITRATYRNRAYLYNTLPGSLTSLKDHKKFKIKLKQYLQQK